MEHGTAPHGMRARRAIARRRGCERRSLDDRRLFCRYGVDRDAWARERLVDRFLPLAERLARRHAAGREPVDDLVQVAALALVKAIERFDHERGVSFTTYAVPTILGELKRHLRDTSWAAHVPQRMQERALRVGRAGEDLRARLGRAPTAEELAGALGLAPEEVAEAAEAASAYDAVSLEWAPAGDRAPPRAAAGLAVEDRRYELVEHRAALAPAVRALRARERLILRLRFERDLTQSEIASLLGISQMHVSRLLRRSLARLREVALPQEQA